MFLPAPLLQVVVSRYLLNLLFLQVLLIQYHFRQHNQRSLKITDLSAIVLMNLVIMTGFLVLLQWVCVIPLLILLVLLHLNSNLTGLVVVELQYLVLLIHLVPEITLLQEHYLQLMVLLTSLVRLKLEKVYSRLTVILQLHSVLVLLVLVHLRNSLVLLSLLPLIQMRSKCSSRSLELLVTQLFLMVYLEQDQLKVLVDQSLQRQILTLVLVLSPYVLLNQNLLNLQKRSIQKYTTLMYVTTFQKLIMDSLLMHHLQHVH